MGKYDKEYFKKRDRHFAFIKALIFTLLIKLFLKPKTLLDVGCAEGDLVRVASRLGIKSLGVDKSKYVISNAKINGGNFRVADISGLPFNNSRFDTVTSFALMEHVPKTEINKAINELLRVAKKYVFLQICVKDSPLEWNKHYLKDKTHINVMPSKWWKKTFYGLGVKYREIIPKFGIFLLYKQMS